MIFTYYSQPSIIARTLGPGMSVHLERVCNYRFGPVIWEKYIFIKNYKIKLSNYYYKLNYTLQNNLYSKILIYCSLLQWVRFSFFNKFLNFIYQFYLFTHNLYIEFEFSCYHEHKDSSYFWISDKAVYFRHSNVST